MRLSDLPGDINESSGDVLDAGVEVQRHLGRRLAERTYRLVLAHELRLRGHVANEEYPLPFVYKDLVVPGAYGVDILVDDKVVVELKCVEALERKHEAQVFGYL